MNEIMIHLDPNDLDDYAKFIAIKSLPRFRFVGRTAIIPAEYAATIGMKKQREKATRYSPLPALFDYQKAIAEIAIRKQKYAVFAECGLGKCLIMLEFARHAQHQLGENRSVLIICPLMVIKQTMGECERFYGEQFLTQVRAHDLPMWMENGKGIGITNYEALSEDVPQGHVGALLLDESSMLKSHYGKWGTECVRLGRGLDWKLCLTGTPAPNDRIEYANHAVFLDQFPTINSFLARFFVNRGQTNNRWELKSHALKPFYRSLSHWSIFLTNPATYGWKDNTQTIPPIHVHIQEVPLTKQQRTMSMDKTGKLFASDLGGICSRSTMGQLAKGYFNGQAVESNKPAFIKSLIDSWPDESTLVWCLYNSEQEYMAKYLGDVLNISGDTPEDDRQRQVDDFIAGRNRIMVSKSKCLGFGLNLHVSTRQIFSGLQDSYETFHQCVKRSNRIGSTKPLNVYIPTTEIEAPMIDTVLRKAKRIDEETKEQERIFHDASIC